MRKIIGVWDQYKDQANAVLEGRGYGPDTFCVQVKETATDAIGWACSWLMTDVEEQRIVDLLASENIPCRHGSWPSAYTFEQAISGEGFERVATVRE
jgi:hypothetical protein